MRDKNTDRYRSGHNGPDSKSGSPHGLVGSNPTLSAIEKSSNHAGFWIFLFLRPPQKPTGLLPSADEIARFRKRHTAHHRLHRGKFRTVIQMGVNVCRGRKIRVPQPILNLLDRYAVVLPLPKSLPNPVSTNNLKKAKKFACRKLRAKEYCFFLPLMLEKNF